MLLCVVWHRMQQGLDIPPHFQCRDGASIDPDLRFNWLVFVFLGLFLCVPEGGTSVQLARHMHRHFRFG
jgi:hypothetical protein